MDRDKSQPLTEFIRKSKYAGTCLGAIEEEPRSYPADYLLPPETEDKSFRPTLAGNALLIERYSKEFSAIVRNYLADESAPPADLISINTAYNGMVSCLRDLRSQLLVVAGKNGKGAGNGR